MFQINDKKHRNVLVSCDHGLMCINRFDSNIYGVGHGQAILDHGNISTVEANACIDSIKNIDNPIIFDIGSNIGTFTNWVARYFKNGKIFCFEPQRLVFQLLCANLAINNIHNVYAFNYAIGDTNAKIKFLEPNYDVPNDFGTFSLVKNTINDKTSELIIDMFTIDTFVNIYELNKLDLIKIDVEGMDLSVLKGSSKTIEKYLPVIFVEFFDNNNNSKDEIQNFLDNYNYNYNCIGNNILATPNKG